MQHTSRKTDFVAVNLPVSARLGVTIQSEEELAHRPPHPSVYSLLWPMMARNLNPRLSGIEKGLDIGLANQTHLSTSRKVGLGGPSASKKTQRNQNEVDEKPKTLSRPVERRVWGGVGQP